LAWFKIIGIIRSRIPAAGGRFPNVRKQSYRKSEDDYPESEDHSLQSSRTSGKSENDSRKSGDDSEESGEHPEEPKHSWRHRQEPEADIGSAAEVVPSDVHVIAFGKKRAGTQP
jgi:hypothetical protein